MVYLKDGSLLMYTMRSLTENNVIIIITNNIIYCMLNFPTMPKIFQLLNLVIMRRIVAKHLIYVYESG